MVGIRMSVITRSGRSLETSASASPPSAASRRECPLYPRNVTSKLRLVGLSSTISMFATGHLSLHNFPLHNFPQTGLDLAQQILRLDGTNQIPQGAERQGFDPVFSPEPGRSDKQKWNLRQRGIGLHGPDKV